MRASPRAEPRRGHERFFSSLSGARVGRRVSGPLEVEVLHLQALKLKSRRRLTFSLAGGTTIRRRVSECRFAYEGIEASSPVVLGERRDEALLGTVTLGTLGLVLNPFERSLKPMRMMLA